MSGISVLEAFAGLDHILSIQLWEIPIIGIYI